MALCIVNYLKGNVSVMMAIMTKKEYVLNVKLNTVPNVWMLIHALNVIQWIIGNLIQHLEDAAVWPIMLKLKTNAWIAQLDVGFVMQTKLV